MKLAIGVDVGKAGGICIIDVNSGTIRALHKTPLDEDGEADSHKHLQLLSQYTDFLCVCAVEKVTGRYGDAAHSAFNFGMTAGKMHMALEACQIEFTLVHPKTWTKYHKISHEKDETNTQWKNRLKALAKSLYPHAEVTLWNADAILLAHYALMVLNK